MAAHLSRSPRGHGEIPDEGNLPAWPNVFLIIILVVFFILTIIVQPEELVRIGVRVLAAQSTLENSIAQMIEHLCLCCSGIILPTLRHVFLVNLHHVLVLEASTSFRLLLHLLARPPAIFRLIHVHGIASRIASSILINLFIIGPGWVCLILILVH
ncbi:hypothetical protein C8T65DRAFT_746952 [Cerioporus squamosus]|nr:hypothetical protein C8T65DRAFT_746952 [Cerioporus squamosus]